MKLPGNRFKAALKSGQHQVGIWNSLGGRMSTELLASRGFDWVLIDTEHAPVDVVDVMAPLQVVAGYPDVSAIVRIASNDPVLIKRYLDLGAQSLLVPLVNSPAEAQAAVDAMRYPPDGIRGVGSFGRASRYGAIPNYVTTAQDQLCLLVQVETKTALDQLEAIANVDGVDGVFIGPADLAASLGHPGNTEHPEVVTAITEAITRLNAFGVPAGIVATDAAIARRWMDIGTGFTAIGIDLVILAHAVTALRDGFR